MTGLVEIMTAIFFILLIVFVAILFYTISPKKRISAFEQEYQTMKNSYEESQSPIEETSHEGHSPYGMYSRNHEDRVGRNLVKHPEPTPGYVVLNGVKVSLKDCKNL